MATAAAAAAAALRRQVATPASPMLRSLLPGPHSKAAAAFLPTVSRLHVAPPLPQPYLLRRYSSKGTDGTAATDIPGARRMNQGTDGTTVAADIYETCRDNLFRVVGQLQLLVGDLIEQNKRGHKALDTCLKAANVWRDDPDKASAMWEEGWDDLMRSAAVCRYCIDGTSKATADIKGTPLDIVLEQNQVFSELMEDYDRTIRELCTSWQDCLSTSRNDMKRLLSDREEIKTLQMIAKGLVTLTLGISLLVLLAFIGLYRAGTFS